MELISKTPLQEVRSRDMTGVVGEVVDQYLNLGSQGMESETGYASLWHQLAVQPLQTTSYLTCLVARLISLDSGHGQRSLVDVLDEIFSPQVMRHDRDEFIRWHVEWVKHAPQLPHALVQRATALQFALLNTMHFVATFYFVRCPKVPRPVYLRWEWVRKVDQHESEQYVFRMVSQESHWANKRMKDTDTFIRSLVDQCRSGYVRGSLSSCVPVQSSLNNHIRVMTSLHFAQLCHLLAAGSIPSDDDKEAKSQRPTALSEAGVHYVIDVLKNLQISKGADEEQLLPLLTLLCNLATMTPSLTPDVLESAYSAVQPFYLWPQPYCEVAKDALDFIFTEQRSPGIHFRRILLAEHSIDLPNQDRLPKSSPESVHIIVDKSAPRGDYFAAAFEDQQPDHVLLKRKLLMHVFYAVLGYSTQKELTELEADLENCFDPDLSHLCSHALIACEEASQMSNQKDSRMKLRAKLDQLKNILAQFRGRQPRASNTSRNSELGITVEEVYAIQARPMLWLPSHRPHEMHLFDGEACDANAAEAALQAILTDHQGRRRKESAQSQLEQVPTSADLKHLRGLAAKAMTSGSPRSNRIFSDSDYLSEDRDDLIRQKTTSLPPNARMSMVPSSDVPPKETLDEVSDGDEPTSGSSCQSNDSTKLCANEIVAESSSSSAEATPTATPKRSVLAGSRDEKSPSRLLEHDNAASSTHPDDGDDEHSKKTEPRSASNTLKPGSDPPEITLDEAASLEDEYRSYLMASSATSSEGSVMSGNSDTAHSNPASRQQSLAPGVAAMSASKSLDFHTSAERADPNKRFTFDISNLQPMMNSARSSASLPKPQADLGIASTQKRSSYSQILKRRSSHKAVMSKKNPIIKIVFAGDDRTVRLMSQAYVQLRRKFKFLLEGLDVKFYYVPLSGAAGGGGLVDTIPMNTGGGKQLPRRFHLYEGAQASSKRVQAAPELMTALFDSDSGLDDPHQAGGDAWLGRYLSHLDGWYERNLMLAVHTSLRVVPQEALDSSSVIDSVDDSGNDAKGPTPRTVVSDAVFNYCRHAQYEVKCRLYQIELTDTSGNKESYVFLQRVEMLVPAKTKRLPELKIQIQKVGLDEVVQGLNNLPTAKYWGMRLSNIPHPSDVCPTTIESLGLELSLMDSNVNRGGSSVFKRSLRGPGQHEAQSYHVSQMDVMATSAKDSFCVAIDSDVCCQNIASFSVKPCVDAAKSTSQLHPRTMTGGLGSRPHISSSSAIGSPGSRRHLSQAQQRNDEKGAEISLPIMMFWPPEL